MALDDDIRILSGVRLFEGFTQEQLRLLAFGAETMQLPPTGSFTARTTRPIRPMSWSRGASASTASTTASASRSAHAGPGAMLGELALIADTRRLTSADGRDRRRGARLNRKMFRRILEEYPETAQALHHAHHRGSAGADPADREAGARDLRRERCSAPSSTDAEPILPSSYSRSNRAMTGTWSDGRSQPRAARRISMPARPATRFADDQTWSSRRPRSDSFPVAAR